MLTRLLVGLLRVVLHAFYRDVEVEGLDRVPAAPRPAIFVLNHPNGLIDPLFVLAVVPRRVAFLAKSTLFRVPLLGALIRGLGCVPVYRQQDQGEDPRRNLDSFAQARALLAEGGTLAIFPEGTSHSDPALRPLKTGAARIALGARPGLAELSVVPAGLYYSQKQTFRSRALVIYGEPIAVDEAPVDDGGDAPREAVQALTRAIEGALRSVTLNAEGHEAHEAIVRAARLLAGGDAGGAGSRAAALRDDFELRRRLERGYARLKAEDPALLAALDRRLRGYERKLAALGLDPALVGAGSAFGRAAALAGREALRFALLLPVAALGAVVHWVPYRLVGSLARHLAESDDVLATYKALGALLVFPLVWALVALGAGWALGGWFAIAALVLCPLLGWVAVRAQDLFEDLVAGSRALGYYAARRRFLTRLEDERRDLADALLAIEERLGAGAEAGAGVGVGAGAGAKDRERPTPTPVDPAGTAADAKGSP